jgi:hypothetical protein
MMQITEPYIPYYFKDNFLKKSIYQYSAKHYEGEGIGNTYHQRICVEFGSAIL